MNRETMKLVATAILLALSVIASAHLIAFIASPDEYRSFNVIRATDRELLQRYETVVWPQAMAELKRRTAVYSYKESTDLAFEVLEVGFRLPPEGYIHTGFFEYSTAFLPKTLADWVQIVGPRRREDLANSITSFVNDQRMRAQWNEPVDIPVLEQLYDDLRTPERYPQFWGPHPHCGLETRLPEIIKADIHHILNSGVPGGAEALKRLAAQR